MNSLRTHHSLCLLPFLFLLMETAWGNCSPTRARRARQIPCLGRDRKGLLGLAPQVHVTKIIWICAVYFGVCALYSDTYDFAPQQLAFLEHDSPWPNVHGTVGNCSVKYRAAKPRLLAALITFRVCSSLHFLKVTFPPAKPRATVPAVLLQTHYALIQTSCSEIVREKSCCILRCFIGLSVLSLASMLHGHHRSRCWSMLSYRISKFRTCVPYSPDQCCLVRISFLRTTHRCW